MCLEVGQKVRPLDKRSISSSVIVKFERLITVDVSRRIRDRSFFMSMGGLVGFGGGATRKKMALKGGATRKKMALKGGATKKN